MARQSRVLARVAFGWMMLVAVLGGAFVIGETFDDPGGWAAAAIVASWLVPLAALAILALERPALAQPVFIVATLLVVAFTLADSAFTIVPRDDWGPVASIVVFALGVAMAFLGLRNASLAGALLLVLGGVQLVASLLERAGGDGPRLSLGGSSGAVIVPILFGGALYLLAGRDSGRAPSARPPRHATAAR
jgi:hypothetical protein